MLLSQPTDLSFSTLFTPRFFGSSRFVKETEGGNRGNHGKGRGETIMTNSSKYRAFFQKVQDENIQPPTKNENIAKIPRGIIRFVGRENKNQAIAESFLFPPSSSSQDREEMTSFLGFWKFTSLAGGDPTSEEMRGATGEPSLREGEGGVPPPSPPPPSSGVLPPLSRRESGTTGETEEADPDVKRLRYWVMMYTTFTEGIEEGLQLNVVYYLKQEIGLSPAEAATLWGASRLPWLLKPLMAFLSDTIPLFGFRRKSYLILAAASHIASLVGLSLTHTPSLWGMALALLTIRSFARAMTQAVSQAILVENNQGTVRETLAGTVADFFWVRAVGILLSSYSTGVLLQYLAPHQLFLLVSVFPTTTIFTTAHMKDSLPQGEQEGLVQNRVPLTWEGRWLEMKRQMALLREAVHGNPMVWGSLAYFLAFMCGPNYDNALYYYYIDKLGFDTEVMGRVQLLRASARLTGPLIYRAFLTNVPFHRLVRVLTWLSIPLYSMPALLTSGISHQLGIPDLTFAVSGEYVREAVLNIQILPPIVAATQESPPGLEGSLFSLFTTIQNSSYAMSRLFSGATITIFNVGPPDYNRITPLILFCGFSLIMPLPLLDSIPLDSDPVYRAQHPDQRGEAEEVEVEAEEDLQSQSEAFSVSGESMRSFTDLVARE